MASWATSVVLGLVLLAAIAGAVFGGGVVRLFALKRLQRHYDEWRLGMGTELGALAGAQDENKSLQTQLLHQAEYIASLQRQLGHLEKVLEASVQPARPPAGVPSDGDEDDVPVLTRRVQAPRRVYRGQKVDDR